VKGKSSKNVIADCYTMEMFEDLKVALPTKLKGRSKSIGGTSEHKSEIELKDHVILDMGDQENHEGSIRIAFPTSLANNKIILLNKAC
jgi:hypothetical protein